MKLLKQYRKLSHQSKTHFMAFTFVLIWNFLLLVSLVLSVVNTLIVKQCQGIPMNCQMPLVQYDYEISFYLIYSALIIFPIILVLTSGKKMQSLLSTYRSNSYTDASVVAFFLIGIASPVLIFWLTITLNQI